MPQYIFLVHGWRWEGQLFSKPCIESFGKLNSLLEEDLECECLPFDYPTGLFERDTLLKAAQSLYREIADPLLTLSDEEIAHTQVAIIAHSMGGVVTRKALTLAIENSTLDLFRLVKLTVFIASPLTGIDCLRLFANVPGFSQQIREFSKGSTFLIKLHTAWGKWKTVQPHCVERAVYGTDDHLVSATEAIISDYNPICVDGYGHVNIKDIHDRSHPLYERLVEVLRTAGFQKKVATGC